MSTLSKNHHPNFNSRLRKETNDHLGRRTGRVYGHFNSRLRKETNDCSQFCGCTTTYFNSRLRKETNNINNALMTLAKKFQLTSQRGDEHKSWYTWIRGIYISTHVSVRRRTCCRCYYSLSILHFNSRLRKETNTIDLSLEDFSSRISIHISARRRTDCST